MAGELVCPSCASPTPNSAATDASTSDRSVGGETLGVRGCTAAVLSRVDPVDLVLSSRLGAGVTFGKAGVDYTGAEHADQEHERDPDDDRGYKQLDQSRTGLGPAASGAAGRHLTVCSRPYIGMITEIATKPTAAPTAMISAGSIRAIMFRTL